MSEFIDNALHRGQICSSRLTDRGKCINTFHLRYLEQTTEERLLDLRTFFSKIDIVLDSTNKPTAFKFRWFFGEV